MKQKVWVLEKDLFLTQKAMENHRLFKKERKKPNTQQIIVFPYPPPLFFFATFDHFLVLVQGTILYLLNNLPK